MLIQEASAGSGESNCLSISWQSSRSGCSIRDEGTAYEEGSQVIRKPKEERPNALFELISHTGSL